ncbi:uncharacterized protein LOC128873524 [Hylaeus volcanicus]|uniref:uncharacterized protein LOC128873524 n=1 Tax=Hylaeus volcanicus TaxID=313075 RepID=UPI0023B77D1D|nr:uncharacterized protein LOC128873524 [Hylaeus volcanicus]
MLAVSPLFLVLAIKLFCPSDAITPTKSTNDTVGRSKRDFETKYLVFPQGSNVQLVYCLTMNTYAKPSGDYTIGITAGQAWELPSKSMFSKYKDYNRRSRRELYSKIELLLGTQGKDGRGCVLKAICTAAARSRTEIGRATFFEEILHVVFALPGNFDDTDTVTEYERAYFQQEKCDEMEDRCPDVF